MEREPWIRYARSPGGKSFIANSESKGKQLNILFYRDRLSLSLSLSLYIYKDIKYYASCSLEERLMPSLLINSLSLIEKKSEEGDFMEIKVLSGSCQIFPTGVI